jgi:hypothetical protein
VKRLLDTGPSPEGLGWHPIGTLLVCAQRYAQSYIVDRPVRLAGVNPATVISGGTGQTLVNARRARSLGTVIHQALAHHYTVMGRLPGWEELFSPEEAIDQGAGPELSAQAHVIWSQYTRAFPATADAQDWEVLAVEQMMIVDLDGIPYGQRADLVARHRATGRVYAWDHKTTGGPGGEKGVEKFALSGQILGLDYLTHRIYGPEAGNGVFINLIRTRPSATAIDRFTRQRAPAAPNALARFEDTVRHARRRLVVLQDVPPAEWPMTVDPWVCGSCDYADRCRLGHAEAPPVAVDAAESAD